MNTRFSRCASLLVIGGALFFGAVVDSGAEGSPLQGNPLGAPAAQDFFATTFEGDGVKLMLQRNGETYTGSMSFQGQTYPVEATTNGMSLKGTFEAGGNRFDFSATLDGETLRLESGGSTYVLKRLPPATPPQPPAVNPLNPGQLPAEEMSASAPSFDFGPAQPDPSRDWTILIYLDGDNNLEPFALSDMNELEAGIPPRGVEIIVLIDRAEGFDEGDSDWTGARIYRIVSDADPQAIKSQVLDDLGEINMGSSQTLEHFVGGALKAFPARRHALVMWNHGGGWSMLATDDNAPGAPNDHAGLTIAQTGAALRSGLDQAGVEKLDLIGFDMCLMAQLETAVEVSTCAKAMVASQAVEPGDGWPYTAVLSQFAKGTLGTTRIASEIVNAYADFYKARGDLTSTQSAMDLSLVPEVMEAFDALVGAIEPTLETAWPLMSRSIFFAESYADMTDIRNGAHALASIDLLDALRRLRHNSPDFAAEAEFRTFLDAMDRFVIASETSPLRHRSNGVAMYAPVRETLFNPAYMETRFAKESAWAQLLQKLHATQKVNSSPPSIGEARLLSNETGQAAASAPPLGGVSVHFVVDGQNILWTQALSGEYDQQQKGIVVFNKWLVVDPEFFVKVLGGEKEVGADALSLIMPEYRDGRNELKHELQGLRYAVSNGTDANFGTIDRSNVSDQDHFAVPIILEHPSIGRLGGTAYFHAHLWDIAALVLEIEQPDGSYALQQVREVPADAKITTLFEFIHEDGRIEYLQGGTMAWNQGLELILGMDSPGDYYVAFTAETIAGDASTAFFPYRVDIDQETLKTYEDGAKFNHSMLLGRWEWMGTPRGATQPQSMGLFTEFKQHPENPDLLIGETTSSTDQNLREVAIVVADTRMLPNIRFLGVDAQGNLSSHSLYSALYASRNGVTLLTLKDASTGRLFGLVQRSAGGGGTGGGGAGPDPSPQPQPAASFSGWWVSDDGFVMGFDQTNWEMYLGEEMIDGGTYTVQGDTVSLQSASSGQRVSFRFTMNADRLTVIDENGETSTLQRVRQ